MEVTVRSFRNLRSETNGPYRFSVIDLACVLLLLAYFLHFALPALSGGFNVDEMTNLYVHWRLGMLKSLWANVYFWKGAGRPAGALYYLPLYHLFGLNPRPYRVVQIGILAASIPMVYYLASLLFSSRSITFLGVLAFCYHAQLANLVFIGSFIYDVLCGFFYFAAITYYVHVREKGCALRPVQVGVFLALYVCALNAKEMAVTLPVIALAYEALRCRPFDEWKQFVLHNCRFAIPALLAGLLTVPYIYGKTMSSTALATLYPYRPRYSWHHFVTTNAQFVNQLLYLYHVLYPKGLLVVLPKALLVLWALVFIYAYIRRERGLQLMAWWLIITPLPLAFIPPRGGACLYLVLFGWAMIFGQIAKDVIVLISKLLDKAFTATAGRKVSGISLLKFRVAATILVATALAIFTQWENQRFDRVVGLLSVGQRTSHVIQAFRSLDLHPASGSTILLAPENRFYQNGYYPAFVASLIWNNRSLSIYVDGQPDAPVLLVGPLGFASRTFTEEQIAAIDYIISFDEFRAKLIRAPGL